jgi:SAM-dependent methyltransferase
VTTPPSAAHFDEWYTGLGSSAIAELVAVRALGLPLGFESTSLLPWAGIAELATALLLGAGDALVDLACGRGSYGLEIARRTGARVIGVDFSVVAIERARENATGAAQFRVGELGATGLDDATAAAVMCIDAMQFADPYPAGLAESLRILRPDGRLVLSGWQARDLADEAIPTRLRHDIAAELRAAGFVDVAVRDMPAWRTAELAHWQAAVQLGTDGDRGAASLREEGERVLPMLERTARVLATARKPGAFD